MKTIIIGAGSTAKIVYEILISSHEYNLVGFVGNNEDKIDLENKKEITNTLSRRKTNT